MLRRLLGVWLPFSHDGVEGVVVDSSAPVEEGEYMPKRVEEVRLRTDRVRCDRLPPSSYLEGLEGSLASLEGVGGVFGDEDSVDLESSSKGRRGRGRRRCDVPDGLSSAMTGKM